MSRPLLVQGIRELELAATRTRLVGLAAAALGAMMLVAAVMIWPDRDGFALGPGAYAEELAICRMALFEQDMVADRPAEFLEGTVWHLAEPGWLEIGGHVRRFQGDQPVTHSYECSMRDNWVVKSVVRPYAG